ncbi:hemoglobin/transferrin/lactoferrin receptor protein [Paucibacter oligotrophus]|uniref:Hemoglobin/transferrin/lactoferrin receptor protein n=2 Tax=Roseateles oligotrophus TaxID=1769250 RepID=A0A840LDP4_9BURK|nr:hemoglobin/transferrin/lactoferrin receptor protein [Roseateles oligotrophus]
MPSAQAQAPQAALGPAASAEPATRLAEITVSSTRTERSTEAVPNTVTVYGKKKLAQRDARDLKDLLEGEVDIAVRAVAPRFTAAGASTGRGGNEGVNIRGLEGNQVLMMVDGIRLPQSFSFGAFASGRLDYLDVDTLASAEVLRGPASAQFGSEGLAGALSLRTLSPEDLLVDGKTRAGFLKSSLLSADNSKRLAAALAGRSGDWEGLLLLSARSGHETKSQGENTSSNASRTAANPSDTRSQTLLAKVGLRLNAEHRLQLALEGRQRRVDTEVLSARAVTVSDKTPNAVIDLDAEDKLQRQRLSLEHRYEDLNAPWLQSLRTQIYLQNSDTRQYAAEDRHISPDRTREGRYKEALIGLSSQAQTQLDGQRLSYGLELSRNRISGLRDGSVPPAGETFPSKPFPDTDYSQIGAFVQSEIEGGSFSLIPGLRYERYQLKPRAEGYSGRTVELSDQAFTPRLGLVWRASEFLQPYAQWALGFRAPTPDQVNNGFANPAQGYTSIGNPELKPEHANSIEIGLRGKPGQHWRWQLSAYDNRYKDFIKQELVGGTGAPKDPLVFQSINLNQARIRGLEARLMWQALPGLDLSAALAHARGHSLLNGKQTPLDTVQPTRASLSARYETGPWNLQMSWLHSEAKKASAAEDPSKFLPPRYDVIDLGAGYRINPVWQIAAFVTNLSDQKYWRWSDMRGIADNALVDAYTAPGRALQLSLRADF